MRYCDKHGSVPALFVCECRRCVREAPDEQFYACAEHDRTPCCDASVYHARMRERAPVWSRIVLGVADAEAAPEVKRMNFFEAITVARVVHGARIRRKDWTLGLIGDEERFDLLGDEESECRGVRLVFAYVVIPTSRSFGVVRNTRLYVDGGRLGPLMLVKIGGVSTPCTWVDHYAPTYDDMFATDWEIVDDDTIAAAVAKVVERENTDRGPLVV